MNKCKHELTPQHRWADCTECGVSYSVFDLINQLKAKDEEIERVKELAEKCICSFDQMSPEWAKIMRDKLKGDDDERP